ncbi:MAG: hypothetical protein ACPGYK_09370 [Flavobacteriales bacterium]
MKHKPFKRLSVWLGLLILVTVPQTSWSQRRPPRQKSVTAEESQAASENAEEKRRQEMWNDLDADRNRHHASQDKATRKRMKRSLKEARKQGRNRMMPWWKRVFSRKRYD